MLFRSRHCIELFVKDLDQTAKCVSIEEARAVEEILKSNFIVLAYPVYYSNLPKIMQDFLLHNQSIFKNKQVFIISTMGLFSGDGSGCGARLLSKYGASLAGGLHLQMPDCIGDEKVLKKSIEQNKALIKKAEEKIKRSCESLKNVWVAEYVPHFVQ